ncbi:MAG TPA: histidine phosphatase family protein [Dehalococcoidia bacterium]|nr:histidine phosphatase family protein [Dehalococcoidia bacterium]
MTTPERLRELAEAQEPRAGLANLLFLTRGEGVTELYLMRHAQIEPSHNIDMSLEQHLTPVGVEQAEVLADYLSRFHFDAVYSSPTLRAQQTAAPIAARQGLGVEVVEDLRDVDQLRPFDRPLPEMITEVTGPDGVEAYIENLRRELSLDAMAPFVESTASFRDRVVGAIEAILPAHAGGRIAVVTHGPVVTGYLAHLAGTPRDFFVYPRLTSISRVLARNAMRCIDFVNATPHFETP